MFVCKHFENINANSVPQISTDGRNNCFEKCVHTIKYFIVIVQQ